MGLPQVSQKIIDSMISSNDMWKVGLSQVSHESIDSMIASNDLAGQWDFL